MKYLRSVLVFSLFACSALAAATPDTAAAAAALAPRDASPQEAPAVQHEKRDNKPKAKTPKYFDEPGADPTLGHYDKRYFHGIVGYDEHRVVLEHLIRSYLVTFRSHGIETWLAHGTLLGWWWNGRIMPWDYDLDVQVSDVTLFYLARNLNRTTHVYNYTDPATGELRHSEYLLDINPNHSLPRGDGQNIIDARWIDTTNGMFIDITGLAERDPKRRPGIWSCKNFHRYRTRELYPLRETEFEGVPASIPYSFDKILTGEYGMKSLVTTEWAGYVFCLFCLFRLFRLFCLFRFSFYFILSFPHLVF